jgi:molybdopterin-binding protein
VPSYRIGEAARMLGTSSDTVRRLVDSGRLPSMRGTGGRRLIDAEALAAYAAGQARGGGADVVVGRSARNRFPGIVTRVVKDRASAVVEIQAGPHRVVSLMTREAADELGLRRGVRAVASVKATSVVVELPG